MILCLCGLFISAIQVKSESSYQNCKIEAHQSTFDVLPGTGWDNLANHQMGRIIDLNFSKCLFSNDNKYLIPNKLSLTPKKISHVELFSETFDHFMNYTSMTSRSVNIDAGGVFHGIKLGGAFSFENTRIKGFQLETKSMLTRVQLRYNVFKSMFEPDAPLYPNFKDRIMDIAGLIVENKDSLYPAYLADMVVRDYGTHVIREIDAGAVLSKTDALQSEYVKKYQSDSTNIGASASASFLGVFNLGISVKSNSSNTQRDEYNKYCSKTAIDAKGGTLLGSNVSLSKWQESVMDNLVPIDRSGDPIYYVLTPKALPELDDKTVHKVSVLIKKAVLRYYTRNGRKGCLDFHSPNFNPDANIDSGTCKSPELNFTLGGTYQTCTGPSDQCNTVQQLNPLTGSYSCPTGFMSIRLHSGLNRCEDYCHSSYIFWTKCERYCSDFATFWCSAKNVGPNHNGYQFGGFVLATKPDCPLGYIPLKIGMNVMMCVTTDPDINNPYAIKFGGLYSCTAGNPLAIYIPKDNEISNKSSKMMTLVSWSKACANGYVAHIATIDRGCQISFCTETNKFSLGSFPNLHRPPFIELDFNPNSTKVMFFKNSRGELFAKDQKGSWKYDDIKKENRNAIIGTVVGCLVCLVFVCLMVGLIQRQYYKRKIRKIHLNNFHYEKNMINYAAMDETA